MIKVGDLVKIDSRFRNQNDSGIGLVYEVYEDFDDESKHGVSVLTQEGKDLGGFSFEEQGLYLEVLKSTGMCYEFENVVKLANDYATGRMDKFFSKA